MSVQPIQIDEIFEKNPKLKREDFQKLKDWCEEQPHLPKILDIQIICLLHSCYYNLEKSKKTLEKFWIIKSSALEITSPLVLEGYKNCSTVAFHSILPEKTPEKWVVYMGKFLDANPKKFIFTDQLNMSLTTVGLNCYLRGPADGLVMLFDAQGVTFEHYMKCQFHATKIIIKFLQESPLVRIKKIHVFNVNVVITGAFAVLKSLVTTNISDVLFFHSSIDTVFDHIPKRILPQEYGGEAPSIADLQKQNLGHIVDHYDIIEFFGRQLIDESKKLVQKNTEPETGESGLNGWFF